MCRYTYLMAQFLGIRMGYCRDAFLLLFEDQTIEIAQNGCYRNGHIVHRFAQMHIPTSVRPFISSKCDRYDVIIKKLDST